MIQAFAEEGYSIYEVNLQTLKEQIISPARDNPATVLSSDDDGNVVIEFNDDRYLVQSIDLEYPERGREIND